MNWGQRFWGTMAATQPRMRLDFPPGGFLRPDGSPATTSSAGGASSGSSGTAAGWMMLFSKWGQTEGHFPAMSDALYDKRPLCWFLNEVCQTKVWFI